MDLEFTFLKMMNLCLLCSLIALTTAFVKNFISDLNLIYIIYIPPLNMIYYNNFLLQSFYFAGRIDFQYMYSTCGFDKNWSHIVIGTFSYSNIYLLMMVIFQMVIQYIMKCVNNLYNQLNMYTS